MSGYSKMEYTIHVNEDKGVIAVRLKNGVEQLHMEYADFCRKHDAVCFSYFNEFVAKYGKQIDKLVGISTCNRDGGDVFNVEFGTRLAQERVMACFESYRTKLYTGLCLKFDAIAEMASMRAEKSDEQRFIRIERVNELVDELKD